MQRIALDGNWQLSFFPEESLPISAPADLNHPGLKTIPATVPGNVEIDLVNAGLLSEPFQGNHIFDLRRLEGHEWWYQKSFTLPEKADHLDWQLVFEGLDTLAEVWINGQAVGRAENMLVAHTFVLTNRLNWGQENQLVVRLRSVTRAAARETYEPHQMTSEGRWEALYIRKAAHVWGWDIMPRAVSAGIWRSVYLQACPADGIDWLYFWTQSASPNGAVLGAHVQVHCANPDPDGLLIRFEGACGEHTFHQDWPLEFFAGGCRIDIPGAKLWWPKGFGAPNLYTLTTSLYRDGILLAQREDQIGLRKLEIEISDTAAPFYERESANDLPAQWDTPPDPDHHFLVRVNGQPVQVRGTNWVPLDALHSRDLARLPRAMEMAVDLGCNMIRCWGGNVYESDEFFAACDREGIMVWQDFAFACAIYPQDEAFLATVRQEVRRTIERLRNHASLAVWCGDNENDMIYMAEGRNPAENRLTREVIPQILQRFDPHRTYLPSSPYYTPAAFKEKLASSTPEQHIWGPRGYYKSSFYTHHSAHFIGEIGYHGCPSPRSIAKFISPQQQWPWQNNPEWQTHSVYHWQKSAVQRDRIQLMANQIKELFGQIPENLEEFALASQITQAEAKKFFIETTRLRKWRTSGIIWWNLLDGWPQFSDAIVDYYFAKKLAYHYIRRAQTPVSLIIGETGPNKYLPLVACNDTLQPVQLTYTVRDADSGATLVKGSLELPANQNWQVARIREFASEQRLLLLEWEANGTRYGSHYLAGSPPFQLPRYCAWLDQIAKLPRPFDVAEL
jgi:beta-mannosidase